MKCLLILALVAGVAHAGLFSSKPKPTAGEKALCTSDGKFDDLCTIYEKDGVQESKEGGQVWRVVKCSCYGEGADEAADIVAKEVATAIGGRPSLNGGISHHWRIVGNAQTWEVTGGDPTKRFG